MFSKKILVPFKYCEAGQFKYQVSYRQFLQLLTIINVKGKLVACNFHSNKHLLYSSDLSHYKGEITQSWQRARDIKHRNPFTRRGSATREIISSELLKRDVRRLRRLRAVPQRADCRSYWHWILRFIASCRAAIGAGALLAPTCSCCCAY